MSVVMETGETYVFIVDTTSYSGNFERNMCGYMTGRVGECGVGSEEAFAFYEEMGLEKPVNSEYMRCEDVEYFGYVIEMQDDHGCPRPASIWRNDHPENNSYNAVAIFMSESPVKDLELLKERAYKFVDFQMENPKKYMRPKKKLEITGFRLQKIITKIEDCDLP